MLKIAHRGAKGYLPENTLAAFSKALEMQVDGIELDIQLSADNEIIVFHDGTLDRLTNGTGKICDYTLAELQQFLIQGEHQIPTLKQVIELVNHSCFINIEIKNPLATPYLMALLDDVATHQNTANEAFIISSFDWKTLEEVRKINPKIPIGVLTETDLEEALAFAKQIKAYSIHPHFKLLNAINTKAIQDNKLLVFPWTANEIETINQLKSYNVNGIITDFTDRI